MSHQPTTIREPLFKLPLVLAPQSEGGYTVTCPLLAELITEGDTVKEALANAYDALAAIFEAYQHLNKPLQPIIENSFSNG